MKTSTKVLLIVSLSMIFLGSVFVITGVSMGGINQLGNFTFAGRPLVDLDHHENVTVPVEPFDSIDIQTESAMVYFVDDEEYYVECGGECSEYTVETVDSTLSITESFADNDNALFDITYDTPEIVIHCPMDQEYKSVTAMVGYGSAYFTRLKCDDVEVSALGYVDFYQCDIKNLTANTEAGDIHLEECTVDTCNLSGESLTVEAINCQGKEFSAETEWGGIFLTDCTFDKVTGNTESGDIQLQNVTVNEETAIDCEYGDVYCDGILHGVTKITCEDGDICVNLQDDLTEYEYTLKSETGSVYVDGTETYISNMRSAPNQMILSTEVGDINLNFAK